MTSVTILAAAFNEEAVIQDFVAAAAPFLEPGWELLIVDDGSVDRTAEYLESLAVEYPQLRIITHQDNRGLGAALSTGFRGAKGEVVVTMDADLTQPFSLVQELVARCRTADAVFASRYLPGGGMRGVPWGRVWVSKAGNAVIRLAFGTKVCDLTTGFRAYRKTALDRIAVKGQGFEAQLEIAVSLIAMGMRVDEIPFVLVNRQAGESKMKYRRLIARYTRTLPALMVKRWRRKGSR